MTTPSIADAAVQAVAEQMLARYDKEFDASHLTWRDFADDARADLTVALPLLGDSRIQYGVQYTTDGDTATMLCSGLMNAEYEVTTFEPATEPRIVNRTVITTSWEPQ